MTPDPELVVLETLVEVGLLEVARLGRDADVLPGELLRDTEPDDRVESGRLGLLCASRVEPKSIMAAASNEILGERIALSSFSWSQLSQEELEGVRCKVQ